MSSTARETVFRSVAESLYEGDPDDYYGYPCNKATDAVLDGLRAGGFVVLPVADAKAANVAVTMMETARGISASEQQSWRETRKRIEEAIRGS